MRKDAPARLPTPDIPHARAFILGYLMEDIPVERWNAAVRACIRDAEEVMKEHMMTE